MEVCRVLLAHMIGQIVRLSSQRTAPSLLFPRKNRTPTALNTFFFVQWEIEKLKNLTTKTLKSPSKQLAPTPTRAEGRHREAAGRVSSRKTAQQQYQESAHRRDALDDEEDEWNQVCRSMCVVLILSLNLCFFFVIGKNVELFQKRQQATLH